MTETARTRRRLQAYGRYDNGRADAEPVRVHVRMLMDSGVGIRRISQLSGIPTGTIGKILYDVPRRERCARRTSDAIMALQPNIGAMADGAKTDSTGTRRRIQALVAIGWTQKRIANLARLDDATMFRLMHSTTCTAATARTIAEIYDLCWQSPLDNQRMRRFAQRRGWVSPLAWHDDEIDDPQARPAATRLRRA